MKIDKSTTKRFDDCDCICGDYRKNLILLPNMNYLLYIQYMYIPSWYITTLIKWSLFVLKSTFIRLFFYPKLFFVSSHDMKMHDDDLLLHVTNSYKLVE